MKLNSFFVTTSSKGNSSIEARNFIIDQGGNILFYDDDNKLIAAFNKYAWKNVRKTNQ